MPLPAKSAIILQIEDVTTSPNPGGPLVGYLEAYIELTGGDLAAPPDIAGFSVFLEKTTGSGTSMTGADRANVNFTPHSGFADPNFAFAFPFTDVMAVANDLDVGTVPLENNAGLFRIEYTIQPSANGTATIAEYTDIPNLTFLTLAGGGQLFFDQVDTGVITLPVLPSSPSVPEPASWLVASWLLSLFLLRRPRKNRSG